MRPSRSRDPRLARAESTSGITLEEHRRGDERELNDGRTSARPEDRQESIHRWFALVLEAIERPHPPDELRDRIAREIELWRGTARKAGIQPE